LIWGDRFWHDSGGTSFVSHFRDSIRAVKGKNGGIRIFARGGRGAGGDKQKGGSGWGRGGGGVGGIGGSSANLLVPFSSPHQNRGRAPNVFRGWTARVPKRGKSKPHGGKCAGGKQRKNRGGAGGEACCSGPGGICGGGRGDLGFFFFKPPGPPTHLQGPSPPGTKYGVGGPTRAWGAHKWLKKKIPAVLKFFSCFPFRSKFGIKGDGGAGARFLALRPFPGADLFRPGFFGGGPCRVRKGGEGGQAFNPVAMGDGPPIGGGKHNNPRLGAPRAFSPTPCFGRPGLDHPHPQTMGRGGRRSGRGTPMLGCRRGGSHPGAKTFPPGRGTPRGGGARAAQ